MQFVCVEDMDCRLGVGHGGVLTSGLRPVGMEAPPCWKWVVIVTTRQMNVWPRLIRSLQRDSSPLNSKSSTESSNFRRTL